MKTTVARLMASFGVSPQALEGGALAAVTPVDGTVLAQVHLTDVAEVAQTGARAHAAALRWGMVPAPQWGVLGTMDERSRW